MDWYFCKILLRFCRLGELQFLPMAIRHHRNERKNNVLQGGKRQPFIKIQWHRNGVRHNPKQPMLNLTICHQPHRHQKQPCGQNVHPVRPRKTGKGQRHAGHRKLIVNEWLKIINRPHQQKTGNPNIFWCIFSMTIVVFWAVLALFAQFAQFAQPYTLTAVIISVNQHITKQLPFPQQIHKNAGDDKPNRVCRHLVTLCQQNACHATDHSNKSNTTKLVGYSLYCSNNQSNIIFCQIKS